MQRPSALQLSESLSDLKQAPQYRESMHQAQTTGGNETGDEIATLRRQVQEVQQQNRDQKDLNQQLQLQLRRQRISTEAKTREASEYQVHSTQLQRMVEAKDRQLQENQQTLATKQHAIETKERQLQQTQQQLREVQQLVEQFQQTLQHKDKTMSYLQQTISHHERKVQHLKQQDIASSIQPQQLPPPIDPHNTRKYIPASFTPVATLSPCTNEGGYYHNDHNDFVMEIPAGAIPEGERITIDIGVALYGPFQYPKDLRPVSPVFWLCIRDQKDFHFLKPVKVTIPHCLNLESHDDIESLGVTFLKGTMN